MLTRERPQAVSTPDFSNLITNAWKKLIHTPGLLEEYKSNQAEVAGSFAEQIEAYLHGMTWDENLSNKQKIVVAYMAEVTRWIRSNEIRKNSDNSND